MLNFCVLGPLEVKSQTRTLRVKGALQRTLLSTLLANARKLVPSDELIDELWGTTPPEHLENALQAHVSRLRRNLAALEPDAPADRLVTRPSGYYLIAEDKEVDAAVFTQGLEQLNHHTDPPATIARNVRGLLELWRGPVFGGCIGGRQCRAAASRFDEARLTALELLYDCKLAAGEHRATISELRELLVDHPYKERFRQQLMLALYRSGRQTEALEVYRELWHQLSEELGLAPSPAMRAYEQAILAQDPLLHTHTPRLKGLARGGHLETSELLTG
jgi:DNA-binding SARP family transcriptional activator